MKSVILIGISLFLSSYALAGVTGSNPPCRDENIKVLSSQSLLLLDHPMHHSIGEKEVFEDVTVSVAVSSLDQICKFGSSVITTKKLVLTVGATPTPSSFVLLGAKYSAYDLNGQLVASTLDFDGDIPAYVGAGSMVVLPTNTKVLTLSLHIFGKQNPVIEGAEFVELDLR